MVVDNKQTVWPHTHTHIYIHTQHKYRVSHNGFPIYAISLRNK